MEREKFELKVGVFVFVGIIALGAMIIILGSKQDMFARQYPLWTEFNEVSGLAVGAPVRLAGVNVGTVEKITFPEEGSTKLRVLLMVRTDVRDRIREDSRASISTQGVLGDKFISLTLGTQGEPLERGTVVQSEQPTDYLAFLETAGAAASNIASITKKIDTMLTGDVGTEAKQSIAATLESVNRVMNEIEKGDGLIHKLIYDKELARTVANVEKTTANLSVITTELKDGKGALGALLNDPKGKETVAKLIVAADNLEKTSASLKTVMGGVERGEGTIGALLMDDGVYDDLRALLGRAKRNRVLRTVIRSTIDKNENLPKAEPAPLKE